MTGAQDDGAFKALTQQISRARGFSCEAYKDKCLRRRIAVRMRARGVHTFEDYRRLLDQDAHEYDLLLDALTINVTKFYRNAETWDALAATHLPALWHAGSGRVRAWSAGCASGEEPYTVAVVLAEAARAVAGVVGGEAGAAPALAGARVDATDVDRASLEKTRAAAWPESAFTEMPPALVRRYFSAAPGPTPSSPPLRQAIPELQRLIRVLHHDLVRDAPPDPPYDLIVCRNVVIYFDRSTQERLFARFSEALRPGGLLVLGKVETLLGAARVRLELLDPRERIYRRPA
ncbi:MAG TPA: protein-glutamate O-methyltransferase CheR [Gemmatimonadales bacterium]|nr:protein-glutamate O-methyltransferase CheR [Gemmatimonadales bacterium]